jgi:hypothetical protein
MNLTERLAVIAILVSFGSLCVSIVSVVIAWTAKQQARQAAALGHRYEAINHLHEALTVLKNRGIASTIPSVRAAKVLPDVVFSSTVRSGLDSAFKEAESIFQENPMAPRGASLSALQRRLELLVEQMKQEAAIVG